MFKLSKQDKIHIFKEWTLEEKRGTYLGKKYGVRKEIINYLVKLIKIHGFSILDKPHTYYSKEYKERAIFGDEAIAAVALDLGLSSIGMLSNWIRSYKENGYNVVIKKKGRHTLEEKNKQRAREAETRKRKASSPEFKAYCRKRIYKKLDALVPSSKADTLHPDTGWLPTVCTIKALRLTTRQFTV